MFILNVEAVRNIAMVAGERKHNRSVLATDVHVTVDNVVIVGLIDPDATDGRMAWAVMSSDCSTAEVGAFMEEDA